jgi:hypothetical protein
MLTKQDWTAKEQHDMLIFEVERLLSLNLTPNHKIIQDSWEECEKIYKEVYKPLSKRIKLKEESEL